MKCLGQISLFNSDGCNGSCQNVSCMAVWCLGRPWGPRGSITWAQRLSALVGTREGVFLLFVVCKCRSDTFRLERERSGVLIHGKGIWKAPKIESSALKIGLEASEKLKPEKTLSALQTKHPNAQSPMFVSRLPPP